MDTTMDPDTVIEVPGAAVTIRPARPADLAALTAMVERCTFDTLVRRFHGPMGAGARRELERIASPTPAHRSWVAVGPDATVHGTSTLAWSRAGGAEVAFMVEDARRRQGIGRALVEAVRREAARTGLDRIEALIQPDNSVARRFLGAVALGTSSRFEDGVTVSSIPIPVAVADVATPTPTDTPVVAGAVAPRPVEAA